MPNTDQNDMDTRNAFRYAERMPQLVTRMDEELASLVDGLIADGVADSRSDAVRKGLRTLIDKHESQRTARAIVQGYTRMPQTEDELGSEDARAIEMINEEPW